MKITLIGMSNVGKSHWAKELGKKGFHIIHADRIIAQKIGTENLSSWLGQPYDSEYKKKSELFLANEKETIIEILNKIENSSKDENAVIDPGGSIIYLEKQVLQKLKNLTKVVYLEAPINVVQEMSELYLRN